MTDDKPKVELLEQHRRARDGTRDSGLSTIEEAIDEYRRGRFVIIVDDEGRENEGDLTVPAEFVTEESIAFMLRYTSGIICVPLSGEGWTTCESADGGEQHGTVRHGFTVSVDARHGITTGYPPTTARRRSNAGLAAVEPGRPGDAGPHLSTAVRDGGILVRAGHTEATADLCRLAGLQPAGALCELMNPDGTMMRMPQLRKFAAKHDLKIISISQLITYRVQRERLIERAATTLLPTKWGDFTLYAYRSAIDPDEHAALCSATSRVRSVMVRCTRSASRATSSARCSATAAAGGPGAAADRGRRAVACWCTCARRAGASASATR
jgi:3,4-dihydroxy 2-butanone 4-phosphate synthase/GTP cyclohydrolase II